MVLRLPIAGHAVTVSSGCADTEPSKPIAWLTARALIRECRLWRLGASESRVIGTGIARATESLAATLPVARRQPGGYDESILQSWMAAGNA